MICFHIDALFQSESNAIVLPVEKTTLSVDKKRFYWEKEKQPIVITLALLMFAQTPWWRHQMETFSASLAICAGIHRWIPRKKAGEAELWCFPWSAPE